MSEHHPLVLIDGQPHELPAGDVLSNAVPITASSFTVPANTSLVAVDELDISDTLIIEGNLAII
jgi:hypothetical protein